MKMSKKMLVDINFFFPVNTEHLGINAKPKREMKVPVKMTMMKNITIMMTSMFINELFCEFISISLSNSSPITEIAQRESHPHRHQHGYDKVSVFIIFNEFWFPDTHIFLIQYERSDLVFVFCILLSIFFFLINYHFSCDNLSLLFFVRNMP